MHTEVKIETFATRMEPELHPDPWELQEEEEIDDIAAIDCKHMDDLRKNLAQKQRQLLIHTVGLASYVAGCSIACGMGQMGFLIMTLMTIGLFCMDRS